MGLYVHDRTLSSPSHGGWRISLWGFPAEFQTSGGIFPPDSPLQDVPGYSQLTIPIRNRIPLNPSSFLEAGLFHHPGPSPGAGRYFRGYCWDSRDSLCTFRRTLA